MAALIDYWDDAVALAGDLDVRDRAILFSPLWGGFERMTELYVTLVTALDKLGHPSDAFSAMEALIPRSKSIIDVETLLGLGKDDADTLDMRTMRGAPVALPRAVVTALTAELRLTIPEKPWEFFGTADLLDFPGARNRNPVDMEEFLKKDDALKELMVRGKVAYLFDRYVAEQELTSIFLVMKPSNQDITGLPALIADWIDRTHGGTAALRQGRPTLLFLVFSWFNLHLERKPGEEGDGLAERFKSRLDGAIKGFLGKDPKRDWTSNWAGGTPFRNSFWLRDPTFSGATFEADGDIKNGANETGVKADEADRLDRMRSEALKLDEVQKHFAEPETAWDRAMVLNDGGTSYLADSLAPVCTPDVKTRQIAARIDDLRSQMAAQLEKFHLSDDGEKRLAERREVAFDIILSIETVADRRRLSSLIRVLQVDEGYLQDHLRRASRKAAHDPKAEPVPSAPPARASSRFGNIRGAAQTEVVEEAPRVQDKALLQAEEMIAAWIAVIGQHAENERIARDLGIATDLLREIVRELAKAARRTDLASRIANEIRLYSFPEDRDRAILRNAVIGAKRISEFASELGFTGRPEAERAVTLNGDASRVVFERPPFVSSKLDLPREPNPPAEDFLMDWGFGLKGLVDENAMSNKGQQVNWKQNAALGGSSPPLAAPGRKPDMAIVVDEDLDQVDGGHAVILLPQTLNGADPGLRITRLRGEPDRLGTDGWQTQATILAPRSVEDIGGGAEVRVGPEICRHIKETTEIEIEIPSIGLSQRMIWPYISPSVQLDTARGAVAVSKPADPAGGVGKNMGVSTGVGSTGATGATLQGQPPVVTKEPGDGEGKGGISDGAGIRPAVVGTDGGSSDAAGVDGGKSDDAGMGGGKDSAPAPKPGLPWVKIAAGLVAAVLVLGAAWVFLLQGPEPATDPEPDIVRVEEEPEPEPEPDPEPRTSEELMQAARGCVETGCDGAAYLAIGQELIALDDIDNAFRVMLTALNQGSGEAGMWLGAFYDPRLDDTMRGDTAADPGQALGYYARAAEAGIGDADGEIAALCGAASTALNGDLQGTVFADTGQSRLGTIVEESCP